jgi:PAS domain S-box-containing protein
VVDDDRDIARSTCRLLAQAGYDTTSAGTGGEALQAVRARPPHLVLLDWQLPDLDGLEVCRQIKADPATAAVLVIIISGVNVQNAEQITALATGADGYIARPIANQDLRVRMDAFARIARLNLKLAEEVAQRRLLEAELENRVRSRTAELVTANQQLGTAQQTAQTLLGAVQAEQTRLAALIGSMADEVWFADPQGNFTLANPAAQREFRLAGGAAIPVEQLARSLEVLRPDGSPRPVAEAPPFRALAGEVVDKQEEMVRTPATGELRYRQVSAAPVRDAAGTILGSVSVVRDITEQKQAELALRAAVEFNQSLIHAMHDGFSALDLQGVHLEANPALCQMTGFSRAELVGVGPPHPYWPPDEYERIQAAFAQTLRGEASSFELTFQRKSGERFPVIVSPSAVRDSQGVIASYAATVKDITERQRAEASLRDSAAQMRAMMEATLESMFLMTADGTVLVSNSTTATRLGLTVEQLVGRNIYEILPPDVAARRRAFVAQVLRTGQPARLEDERLGRWLDNRVNPVFDSDGQVRRVVAFGSDITERKRAEELLRERERQLATLMRNLPGMAYRCCNDPDRTMTFVSHGCLELIGYAAEELLHNQRISYASLMVAEDQEPVWAEVQRGVLERRPFQMRYRIRTAAGTEKWVWEQGVGVYAADGTLEALEGFISDITKHKRAEAALLEAEQRFRGMFERHQAIMLLIEPHSGAIEDANQAAADFYGQPLAELRGMNIQAINCLPPAEVAAERERALAEQRNYFVFPHRLANGEIRTVEVHSTPIVAGRRALLFSIIHDITERTRVETALRESEYLLRESQSSAGLGSYVLDISSGRWQSSAVLDQVFGIDKTYERSIAGWTALVHPTDRVKMADYFRDEVVGQGRSFNKEYRILRHENQAERWVHGTGKLEFDGAGHPVRMLGTIQDISERRQAEVALRESEAKYRRLFDNAPLGIFQSTAEGKAISINPAFARMFGYDSVEDALQNIENVGADIFADPNRRAEILRLITENPNLRVFENVYRRKGGGTFIGSLNAAPIRDAAGALIRVEGIVEDITERKQAEAALRSFAIYTRSLLEASLDPLVTISADGKITDVNDASVQATGLPRASLIGTDFSDYFTEPAKAREGYERVFLEGFVRDYPLTLRHDSGRVAEVLYNAAVYRDEQGQVRGVCAAARDITERQQAEAKVRALLEQAQRDAHAKAELLKEVNHRVKNNLLAILGLALAEQRHVSAEEKPVARRITGNLRRRLEGLLEVHQMLSASQWAPVPVDHLARRIIESALSAVPTGCQVTLALAPSAGLVSPRQASNLALVLNELATNTIKYALAGRTTARITLATTSTDATLRLDYRDDGPGYPPAVLRQEGLSTGLELVRDITTQTLRGRFTLANDAGAVTVLEIMAEEVHRT